MQSYAAVTSMARNYGIHYRVRNDLYPSSRLFLKSSLALNGLLLLYVWLRGQYPVSSQRSAASYVDYKTREVTAQWHGGHPAATKSGSCWCGSDDKYCMCTPNLAIDLVIASGPELDLWLVRRKDTGQLATMGGFVNLGESVETAVKRELMEEMGIVLDHDPVLFGLYSDPRRDNRRHTVSAVYAVQLNQENIKPKAGDDAKEVKRISLREIEKYHYFADHKTILMDFRRSLNASTWKSGHHSSDGDYAFEIARSVCIR